MRTNLRSVCLQPDLGSYESVATGKSVSLKRIKAILTNVAKLHAWGWGKDVKVAGKPLCNWYANQHGLMPGQAKVGDKKRFAKNPATLNKAIRNWESDTYLLEPRVKHHMARPDVVRMLRSMQAAYASWWVPMQDTTPETLCHGDCHGANNVYHDSEVTAAPSSALVYMWPHPL
jgi:hypothetical protein